MRKITERERIEIEHVFNQPGWSYFEEYLREYASTMVNAIKEVPSDLESQLQREQNLGKLDLAQSIVSKYRIQINEHTI